MKKTCRNCGKEFEDRSTNQIAIWCSERCRHKGNAKLRNSTLKIKEGGVEMKPNLVDVQELATAVIDKLQHSDIKLIVPKRRNLFRGKLLETAVLLLSDIHSGQINKFCDPESGKMETTYNTQIMKQEFDRLLDGIKSINEILSHSYRLDKLYIFGLGDYIENDVIYRGQRFFVDRGVGDQLSTIVDILSQLFTALLADFKEIEFICVIGNHGRFQMSHEAAPTSNSFDYLMGKMLQIMFKDEKRVKITLPESWYYFQKIYDWKYFLHHGDTVYSWMSLPYYGLKRQGTSRRVETPFDVECIGHFHQIMTIPIGGNSKTIVNGSFIPKSDFGWKKFGILSKAEQYYFGVSPKRPRSWRWTIDLTHSLTEWKEVLRG